MFDASKLSVSCIFSQVADSNGEFFLKSSELFESPVYLEEVADVLCILQAGIQLISMSFTVWLFVKSVFFSQ